MIGICLIGDRSILNAQLYHLQMQYETIAVAGDEAEEIEMEMNYNGTMTMVLLWFVC